MNSSIMMTAIS